MTRLTVIWGVGLVAEFALGVVLVLWLPVAEYLIVGPILGYAVIGLLTLWTFVKSRAGQRRWREAEARHAQANAGVEATGSAEATGG